MGGFEIGTDVCRVEEPLRIGTIVAANSTGYLVVWTYSAWSVEAGVNLRATPEGNKDA